MIAKWKRERFELGRAMFELGYHAARRTKAVADGENVDCQMCASDAARTTLGFSCDEWRAFCGPQGLDCPSVACSDPDAS